MRLTEEVDARRRCDRKGERDERKDTGEAAEEAAAEFKSEERFRWVGLATLGCGGYMTFLFLSLVGLVGWGDRFVLLCSVLSPRDQFVLSE